MNNSGNKKFLLITGAGGYIGSVMAKFFLENNYKVRILDRFYFGEVVLDQYIKSANLEIIKDDIRSVSKNVFNNIDYVIDLASLSNDPSADLNPKLTEEINVKGAIRFAKLAKKSGIRRYIYASSCSVYGENNGQKLTEESPLLPVSLYAKCKIRVEKTLLSLASNNFIVTIGRNATCYGLSPRMRFDLAVNIMTSDAFKSHKIRVNGGGEQWRPFVHIIDVARAYFIFLEASPQLVQRQVFNVGSNEQNYQMLSLANSIKKNFSKCEIEILQGDIDKRDYNVSFNKINSILNYNTTKTIQDGVKEIKSALENNLVTNDMKSNTVRYYKHLIETDRQIENLKINGKLF